MTDELENLKQQLQDALAEMDKLRRENVQLKQNAAPVSTSVINPKVKVHQPVSTSSKIHSHSSAEEKIALFRQLFRGREDVFPKRWESKNNNSGYPVKRCTDKVIFGLTLFSKVTYKNYLQPSSVSRRSIYQYCFEKFRTFFYIIACSISGMILGNDQIETGQEESLSIPTQVVLTLPFLLFTNRIQFPFTFKLSFKVNFKESYEGVPKSI